MPGSIPPPHLSVIIPAFDEELRLASSLPRALGYLEKRGHPFEVLVVDDGSRDRTVEVARSFANRGVSTLSLERNHGKGAAVRAGVLTSRGRSVLISDADLSTPIEDLERLESAASNARIALGSRALEESEIGVPQPGYRRAMGWVFRRLVGCLALPGVLDSQCGFKLLDGTIARSLFRDVVTEGFSFDVELLYLARRRGVSFQEVPVRWSNDQASKVRPWIDPLYMLLEILAFRFHHRRHSKLDAESTMGRWVRPSERRMS